MDNIVKEIRKWERRERKVNIGLFVSAALSFVFATILAQIHGGRLVYEVMNTLSWIGLATFIALGAAKVFIHCFMLGPLIRYKLSEFAETTIADPDFDVDKYVDWK